ncbi:serine/threonine-protein kinase [Actinoplanes sp. NPDC023801]|uniref:serine/threonine protein kinase n=1 Tax=Actinoplanes sp. NPDC023801 TaxID=3154595 RepID=UPI0033F1D682
MPLRPGDPATLGRYELVGRLGEGGMGTVFLGREPGGRQVAIKMVRPEFAHDAEFRGRFRSEVNRAKQVPPFSTAEVLDADPDHEPPYLVVEYVDGPSLAAEIRATGPLTETAVHGVAVGIATALTAIHGAGVIHRDLKPGNVLFARGGIKVIDFGIARAFEATSQHTRTDQLVGTVAYMAPERFDPADGRPVTAAADIFAWGAVVAFAATGRTPFAAESAPATAMRILTQEPDLNGVPFSLRGAVERALAKEPGDRPTARELLDLVLAGATPPLPPALAGPTVPTPALPAPAPSASALSAPAPSAPAPPAPEQVPDDAPLAAAAPVRPRRRTLAVVATAVAVVLAASAGVLIRNDVFQTPAAAPPAPGTSPDVPALPVTSSGAARTPSPEERLKAILLGKNRMLIHAAEIDRDLAYDRHFTEVEAGNGTGAKSEFALIPMGVDFLIRALYDPDGEEVCLGVRLDPDALDTLVGTECAATKGTLFELIRTDLLDDKNRPRYYLYNDTHGFLQWDADGGSEGTGAFYVQQVGDAQPLTTFSFVDRGPVPSPSPSR